MNKTTVSDQIVQWMINYANTSNRKEWVVGVSGGVDSALVSTLCAMTGLPTHCVVLPCQSKQDGLDNAYNHIGWLQKKFGYSPLNVNCNIINLTSTFIEFTRNTSLAFDNALAYANAKSRLRMIALYQIATCVGGLVVGTGNKVEDGGVRFFTKYGDGGVDISPIADLMKSEVRQMCRELGVLPELCEAIPTDGLWSDTRTDESQIGASYEELEWAMKFLEVNNGWPDEETIKNHMTERQYEVLNIYNKWNKAGAHKMAMPPTFVRKS